MSSWTPLWRFAFVEASAIVLLGVAAFAFPRALAPWFRRIELAVARIARRPRLAFLVIVGFVLCARLAYWPLLGIPAPAVHDEFSYLLAGDTFAHGHLTNPPHPMWQHFETFHIIQQPTYQSMYPPAQGLALAAGEILLGNFWFGVLLSASLMCGVFYWAFSAWVPRRWAFAGAIVVAVRIGIFSYWVNSYWGGAVAAIGGALMLGAWPRIRRKATLRDALLMALGLSILANSRPFEGLVFSIPVGVAMVLWLARQRTFARAVLVRRVILPIAAVLALTFVAMGIYFHAVTGSAFRMPFEVNRQTYAVARLFIFQKPYPIPQYRHFQMRVFYVRSEYLHYLMARSIDGWRDLVVGKARDIWAFFLGAALLFPLLAFTRLVRDRRMRVPLAGVSLVFIGSSFVWFSAPHYFAPAACALYVLVLRGLQHIRSWRRHGAGVVLAWGILLICVLSFPLQPDVRQLFGDVQMKNTSDWWTVNHWFPERTAIEKELRSHGGKDLVIVRYTRTHSPDQEWVYNAANIDAAPVIWARDMGAEKNRELLNYYKDRKVWVLEPDHPEPKLAPYASDATDK